MTSIFSIIFRLKKKPSGNYEVLPSYTKAQQNTELLYWNIKFQL